MRADGVALADSEREPAEMGNHRQRPEIVEAERSGVGYAERDSETVGRHYRYEARAVRLEGELAGFVRAAFPLEGIDERISGLRISTMLTALVAAGVAVLVAASFARRVSAPPRATAELAERIASGDYRGVGPVEGADEIRRLSEAIATMTEQLEERLDTITGDRNKVLAIGGMVEGVVAIDREERVVHMNAVAARLLGLAPGDKSRGPAHLGSDARAGGERDPRRGAPHGRAAFGFGEPRRRR